MLTYAVEPAAIQGAAPPRARAESAPEAKAEQPSPLYWDKGRTRIFAAGRVSLGASAYAELNLGVGKPFWLWAGFVGWGRLAADSAMTSLGFKIALPVLEVGGGLRLVSPFNRGPLEPREVGYDSADLERSEDNAQLYGSFDLEATGFVPLPHVVLVPQLGFHYIGEQGSDQYEELQRVIMGAPWLWYGKLGALVTWGESRRYALGPQLEHFRSDRPRAITRLGPSFRMRVTPHVEAVALLTLPISSPDHLPLYESLGGVLSLRYRWASGEQKPAFP